MPMRKPRSLYRRATSFAVAVGVLLTASVPVFAHEERKVGPYTVEVGWRDEPALAGLLNAVEVEVRETASSHGVEGLSKTLTLSITFGGGRSAFTPELRSLGASDPGHYLADIIPTAPGDYVFRLRGKIGTQDVDETFESGPGRFDAVRSASAVAFPTQDVIDPAAARDLREFRQTAEQNRYLALVALAIGVAALALSIVGRRRT